MYGTQGVCTIVEITEKDFMGTKKEYYVLKPVNDKAATLFAPVNTKANNKMRRILSKEEVCELLRTIPEEKGNWISNENRRKEEFKRIIANGEHSELIKMVKSLYLQREKREVEGKHLYLSDERFLKEAERILCDEFKYVLEIEREEVLAYLKK